MFAGILTNLWCIHKVSGYSVNQSFSCISQSVSVCKQKNPIYDRSVPVLLFGYKKVFIQCRESKQVIRLNTWSTLQTKFCILNSRKALVITGFDKMDLHVPRSHPINILVPLRDSVLLIIFVLSFTYQPRIYIQYSLLII